METELFHIIKRLNKLNVLHRINIYKAAAKHGMYMGQMPLLEFVQKHDKCTQKELSKMLQVSPPSVAVSIKRMQKANLIEKSEDENDLRCTRITLTEKGKEKIKQCRADFDNIDAKLFTGFTKDECEQFKAYLDRLINNLSTDELENKTMFSLMETSCKLFHAQDKKEEEDNV